MEDSLKNGRTKERTTLSSSKLGLPKRVLVADDEGILASMLCSHLLELGCEAIGPASNGRDAIELAHSTQPDLALLDIRMPELDGIEVAKQVWGDLGIPVVIISAYGDDENVKACTDIGVFGYMLKPVERDSVRASISVAWSRVQALMEQTNRVAQLERNLANRRVVEQAKWTLVEGKGMSEGEAHQRMQTHARNSRAKLADVAAAVLSGELTLTEPGEG